MSKQLRPVAMLPWLELHNEVKVGRVSLWPYEKLKHRNLPSTYETADVDKYASIFYAANKNQAPVTCISCRSTAEKPLSGSQASDIMNVRYALFAAAYVKGLCDPALDDFYNRCPSAEHFALYSIPIESAMKKGHFSLLYPRSLTLGVIDGFSIDQPQHLHRCQISFLDPLLKALSAGIKHPHTKDMPYVLKSLEWFFYAQSTQEHFTEEARIVLLCMAIDAALLETQGREDFVNKIGNVTNHLNLPKRWRVKCRRNGRDSVQSATIIEKWASDFYELRNCLVHSKARTDTSVVWSRKQPHIFHHIIASYIWFECLWDTLTKLGLVPPEPDTHGDIPTWSKWFGVWNRPIKQLREWWKSFLLGKIDIDGY